MHSRGTKKETGKIIKSTVISTPLGNMLACADTDGICLLEFEDRPDLDSQLNNLKNNLGQDIKKGNDELFQTLQRQLDEYFTGQRTEFDLPVHMVGTAFQKKTWSALSGIFLYFKGVKIDLSLHKAH